MPKKTTHSAFKSEQAKAEATLVRQALRGNGWVLTAAAEQLEVTPSTLRKMVDRVGLRDEYRRHNTGPGRPSSK